MTSALDLKQYLQALKRGDDGPRDSARHSTGAKCRNYRLGNEFVKLGGSLARRIFGLDDIFGALYNLSQLLLPRTRMYVAYRYGLIGMCALGHPTATRYKDVQSPY